MMKRLVLALALCLTAAGMAMAWMDDPPPHCFPCDPQPGPPAA